MKKFLFIGALLALTATSSFGAVTQVLESKQTAGSFTGNDLAGEASLKLMSRGTVIDATDKAVLILTPTVNAGADGESLSFDFGNLVKGQAQVLNGKFTAQVITEDKNVIKELPFGQATVDMKIERAIGVASTNGTIKDNTIKDLELLDLTSGNPIGKLGYQLIPTPTNSSTYTGDVIATVKPEGTGTFANKDAKVTVSVTNFTFSK